ncbi:hypothetical protein D3C81_1251080 [compost metagenome]
MQLEELAQRERRAVQTIQTALHGHQTAMQQFQRVAQIAGQLEHSVNSMSGIGTSYTQPNVGQTSYSTQGIGQSSYSGGSIGSFGSAMNTHIPSSPSPGSYSPIGSGSTGAMSSMSSQATGSLGSASSMRSFQ